MQNTLHARNACNLIKLLKEFSMKINIFGRCIDLLNQLLLIVTNAIKY